MLALLLKTKSPESGNIDVNAMDVAFFSKYTKSAMGATTVDKAEEYPMSKADADSIIRFLSAGYFATTDPEARREFN